MNILLLREALLIAKEYGIGSLSQFEVFISISQADGIIINDLAGCSKYDDLVIWNNKASMCSNLLRVDDRGEALIYRSEPVKGLTGRPPYKLRLTNKGFRLLAELNKIGFH